MKPTILYSDLDGTLIRDGAVSAANRKAIDAFLAAGGSFSIATGRSEETARLYAETLPLTAPAILYNGAAVYDYGRERFLHKATLPASLTRRFTELALRRFPQVGIQAFPGGATLLLTPSEAEDTYISRENQAVRFGGPADCGECFKLLFHADESELKNLENCLREEEGEFLCLYSSSFYLEILPLRATKGDALAWVADYLQREAADFAAIGDYDNDVSMLAFAGLGAAPGDAKESAKAAADVIVAPHREEAVADFIRRLLT